MLPNANVVNIILVVIVLLLIFFLCLVFSVRTSQIKVTVNGNSDTNALEARDHMKRITVILWLFLITYIAIVIFVFMKYGHERTEIAKNGNYEKSIDKRVSDGQISILIYVLGTVSFIFTFLLMGISTRVCINLQKSAIKSDNMKIYNLCLALAIISGFIILAVITIITYQTYVGKNKNTDKKVIDQFTKGLQNIDPYNLNQILNLNNTNKN